MKNRKVLGLVCGLLAAALAGGLLLTGLQEEPPVENAGTVRNGAQERDALTWQGRDYPIREKLQTVLLIGTDSAGAYVQEDKFQDYYNYSQADVLMLLVLDRGAGTAQVIQLNRDTMAQVPWLDVLGNYGGTEYKQLCLAYNYGDGGRKSCKNTVDAVSRLLFDAPIDSYVQLPLSAIGVLNDLVGGVPVTIQEDMTAADPAFVPGAVLRLTGPQAERFLRARMALEDDTNLSRMARHRMYLDSFRACAQEALDSDDSFSMKLVEALSEHLQSDMTAQQLTQLVEDLDGAQIGPIASPEGTLTRGEEYYEFHVDTGSLWTLVKNAYCEKG